MSTGDVVASMETATMTRRSRPSPTSLTNLPDILSALSELESEEAETAHKLSQLLSSQESIQKSLARLKNLAPQLDELHIDASHLSDKVSSTAKTADRVGSRVRRLDEEMKRVREASERVGQVMELKVLHRSVSRFTHISYRAVGFASFFTVFNTIPRLGVCF